MFSFFSYINIILTGLEYSCLEWVHILTSLDHSRLEWAHVPIYRRGCNTWTLTLEHTPYPWNTCAVRGAGGQGYGGRGDGPCWGDITRGSCYSRKGDGPPCPCRSHPYRIRGGSTKALAASTHDFAYAATAIVGRQTALETRARSTATAASLAAAKARARTT